MESLKKAEGIYLKEKDFLFEKMKDLSESCSMYEENNRILQEEAKKQRDNMNSNMNSCKKNYWKNAL